MIPAIINGVLKIGELILKRTLDADQIERLETCRRDKIEALCIDAGEKYILENLQAEPNQKLLKKYQHRFFKFNQSRHL